MYVEQDQIPQGTKGSDDHEKIPSYCQSVRITDSNGHIREYLFPKGLDLDRPKRARTTFSRQQLQCLEHEFLRNQYLIGKERTALAESLGLSETQVKVWFQNRRTKHKRERSKAEETRKTKAESVAASNVLRLLEDLTSPTPLCTLERPLTFQSLPYATFYPPEPFCR